MTNVVQGNFKQVERGYGYKKISEAGVETLEELLRYLTHSQSITQKEMPLVISMVAEVLQEDIKSKFHMTDGDARI